MLTVALVNQDRENNTEKRSQGLKSEKEALLIGKKSLFITCLQKSSPDNQLGQYFSNSLIPC